MEEQNTNMKLGVHVDAFLKSVEENKRQYDRVSVKDGCIVIQIKEEPDAWSDYWFHLSEVETAAGVCSWLQQLMEKTWFKRPMLEKVLALIAEHNAQKDAPKAEDNGL